MGNRHQPKSDTEHSRKRSPEVSERETQMAAPNRVLPLSPSAIMKLQRTIGNQAVLRLLDAQRPAAPSLEASTPQPTHLAIQRWTEREHKEFGDVGSGGRRYGFGTVGFGKQGGISENTASQSPKQKTWGEPEAADNSPFPFQLTHGDLNMLGDWFELNDTKVSKGKGGKEYTDSLFVLAQRPSDDLGQKVGTWDEIIYAIYKNNPNDRRFDYGQIWAPQGWGRRGDARFSKEVKDRVNARYLRLASQNKEHFPTPQDSGPTGHSYVEWHEDALWRAYRAGQQGNDIGAGLAREAAAQHFLTDYFSAGHIRTPIMSIKDYWQQKYPEFYAHFLQKIAYDVAEYMNDNETNAATIFGSVKRIYKNVLETLMNETGDLPPVTFGDVVGRVSHDVDNEQGVWVVNDRGDRWLTYGDSRLHKAAPGMKENRTLELAALAVRLGNSEIEQAFQMGEMSNFSGGLSRKDLLARIKAQAARPPTDGTKYAPEQVVPRLDPTVDNGKQNWQVESIEKLWNLRVRSDQPITWGEAINDNLERGEIGSTLDDIAIKFPRAIQKAGGWLHPRAAYINGFLNPLKEKPYQQLLNIISFTPP